MAISRGNAAGHSNRRTLNSNLDDLLKAFGDGWRLDGRMDIPHVSLGHHIENKKRGFLILPSVNRSVTRLLPEEEMIRVYRETIRPLYSYVSRRVGGDLGLAEDFVQETWMRALDTWPRKGIPTEPLAWLQRVARNTLVSHFRRMRPESIDPALIDIEDEKFTPATPDAAAIVGWGMARLRRSQSDILEAFYFEGKAVREIAAERSVSERAVEGRLRRARTRLRKKLDRILRVPVAALGRVAKGGTDDAR